MWAFCFRLDGDAQRLGVVYSSGTEVPMRGLPLAMRKVHHALFAPWRD